MNRFSLNSFRKLFPLWVIPPIILFSITTVWLRLSLVKTTYNINQTEKMIANAQRLHNEASIQRSHLKSPRRLEAISKTKFKLNAPQSEQVIYIQ